MTRSVPGLHTVGLDPSISPRLYNFNLISSWLIITVLYLINYFTLIVNTFFFFFFIMRGQCDNIIIFWFCRYRVYLYVPIIITSNYSQRYQKIIYTYYYHLFLFLCVAIKIIRFWSICLIVYTIRCNNNMSNVRFTKGVSVDGPQGTVKGESILDIRYNREKSPKKKKKKSIRPRR